MSSAPRSCLPTLLSVRLTDGWARRVAVESSALEGHLKLCTAGGRSSKRASAKVPFRARAGRFGLTTEERQQDEPTTQTRHDPDFKNESLHKKKWAGVLDEEEAQEGPGLMPQYDALRGGIRLKLYAGGGAEGFNFEEHYFPEEAGSLGGGLFSGKNVSPRFPRASSDSFTGAGAAFWAKHEQRRRAQDMEFEQGAKAFERARSERMQVRTIVPKRPKGHRW